MNRRTATIDGLDAAPGDHVCAFYRGEAQRRRILAGFVRDGLAAADHCLCITSEDDHAFLRASVPGTDVPAVTLESFARTYTAAGAFDREHMLAYWQRWAVEPVAARGRRTVSDMSWATEFFAGPGLADFMAYEAEATRFARETSAVALCLYDTESLGGDVILAALRVHPKMLFNGALLQNPYCPAPAPPL